MIKWSPCQGHRVGVGDLSPAFHIRAQLRAGRHWSRRATRATRSHWSVTTPSLRRSWACLFPACANRKSIARVVMVKCRPLLCTASVSEDLSTLRWEIQMAASLWLPTAPWLYIAASRACELWGMRTARMLRLPNPGVERKRAGRAFTKSQVTGKLES